MRAKKLASTFALLGVFLLSGLGSSCAKASRFSEDTVSRSFAAAPSPEKEKSAVNESMDRSTLSLESEEAAGQGREQTRSDARSAPERKLVKRASISLRVDSLEEGEKAALGIVRKFSGYVANTRASENRVAMSLRIPTAAFDEALSALSPIGKILERSVGAEDVTLAFYDLEGRLATKRELLVTLRGYLKQAKSIEDIMAVETRLSELQDEIDGLGSEFASLANLVDFSSIELELFPPPSAIEASGPDLGDKLSGVLRNVGGFFSTLAALALAFLVFGLPLLALATLLYWLLFGKIGLLLRLWRLVAGKKRENKS